MLVFRRRGNGEGVAFQFDLGSFLEAVHKADQTLQAADVVGAGAGLDGDHAVDQRQLAVDLDGFSGLQLSLGIGSGDWVAPAAPGLGGKTAGGQQAGGDDNEDALHIKLLEQEMWRQLRPVAIRRRAVSGGSGEPIP